MPKPSFTLTVRSLEMPMVAKLALERIRMLQAPRCEGKLQEVSIALAEKLIKPRLALAMKATTSAIL